MIERFFENNLKKLKWNETFVGYVSESAQPGAKDLIFRSCLMCVCGEM